MADLRVYRPELLIREKSLVFQVGNHTMRDRPAAYNRALVYYQMIAQKPITSPTNVDPFNFSWVTRDMGY